MIFHIQTEYNLRQIKNKNENNYDDDINSSDENSD